MTNSEMALLLIAVGWTRPENSPKHVHQFWPPRDKSFCYYAAQGGLFFQYNGYDPPTGWRRVNKEKAVKEILG